MDGILPMHAAAQHFECTIDTVTPQRPVPARATASDELACLPPALRMNAPEAKAVPRELCVQGLTQDGKAFRPSDWAERLAGAMSCFRPGGGAGGIGAFIGYSPYCVPTTVEGVRCVIVNEALRDLEPMAWDFVMNFARDNQLKVVDAGELPNRG
jgi:hypothetical protein